MPGCVMALKEPGAVAGMQNRGRRTGDSSPPPRHPPVVSLPQPFGLSEDVEGAIIRVTNASLFAQDFLSFSTESTVSQKTPQTQANWVTLAVFPIVPGLFPPYFYSFA